MYIKSLKRLITVYITVYIKALLITVYIKALKRLTNVYKNFIKTDHRVYKSLSDHYKI